MGHSRQVRRRHGRCSSRGASLLFMLGCCCFCLDEPEPVEIEVGIILHCHCGKAKSRTDGQSQTIREDVRTFEDGSRACNFKRAINQIVFLIDVWKDLPDPVGYSRLTSRMKLSRSGSWLRARSVQWPAPRSASLASRMSGSLYSGCNKIWNMMSVTSPPGADVPAHRLCISSIANTSMSAAVDDGRSIRDHSMASSSGLST